MLEKYNYKVVLVKRGMSLKKLAENIETKLNEMSADGWTLDKVVAEGFILILRRPKL